MAGSLSARPWCAFDQGSSRGPGSSRSSGSAASGNLGFRTVASQYWAANNILLLPQGGLAG